LSLEKFIKYSVPFFVIAIISRSIEEISFIYYVVPVMSLLFIVVLLFNSKLNSTRKQVGLNDSDSRRAGMTDSEQVRQDSVQPGRVGMTGSKIGNQHPSPLMLRRTGLPSSIIHQPYFLFLLPGLWFLLTLLWSSYPEISALRALYFILISTGCISAGILWIRYSNKNIFDFLLPANLIVVLICVFSILTNIPSDSWTAGHGKGFIGFFGHQNLLASVLLFTLPVVFGVKIKAQSKKLKVFIFILLTLNFILLILTYSRSAIVAMIFGLIVFLILNKNWKVLSYGFIVAVILTSIIYFTPSLNNFADKILKKDFPEVYSSRLWMWEPSYNAAFEGGFFGLGYGISHPEIRSGEYSDRFEDGRLIREKGNSSLALIEESGVIGLVLFLIPVFYILLRVIIGKDSLLTTQYSILNTNYSLLTAALAAFILHAQFEAWWIGVGSVQLPLFLLYIGLTIHLASVNEIKA
jgi:O-antigen ligase